MRRRRIHTRKRQRKRSRGNSSFKQKRTLKDFGYNLTIKKDTRRAALQRAIEEKGSGTVYWLLEDQINEISKEKARIPLKKIKKLAILNNDREWLIETYEPRLIPFEAMRSWEQMNTSKYTPKENLE